MRSAVFHAATAAARPRASSRESVGAIDLKLERKIFRRICFHDGPSVRVSGDEACGAREIVILDIPRFRRVDFVPDIG